MRGKWLRRLTSGICSVLWFISDFVYFNQKKTFVMLQTCVLEFQKSTTLSVTKFFVAHYVDVTGPQSHSY